MCFHVFSTLMIWKLIIVKQMEYCVCIKNVFIKYVAQGVFHLQ